MIWKPEGIYPALLTSFQEDGTINDNVMHDIVDFCITSGCTGLFAVSSVGEFVHLEFDEACHLMEVVTRAAGGRVPVVAGVTASHIDKSIRFAKYARQIGCTGIVCSAPYFYTVTQEIIERHYQMLAEAVPDMPLIMYNIPLFSTPLSYETVRRVAAIPSVVAMKDSSGSLVDFVHYMDMTRLADSDIHMMCGREEMIMSTTMLGGKGAMVGTATIFPEILVNIYQSTLAGNYDTARTLQLAICTAIREMFSVPFPLGFKAAMEVRGFDMGPPKAALSEADRARAQSVKQKLHYVLSELCDYVDIPLIRGRGMTH